jgi:molecular chaperone DnaK (HSP70)
MNNLLFTALIIALIYYFFYYLPQKKKEEFTPSFPNLGATNPPLKHHQVTQTETITATEPSAKLDPEAIKKLTEEKTTLLKDLQQKEKTIIGLNNSYNKLETKSKKEIEDLKNQIKTITHQLKELKTHQTKDQQDLEKTLDELLKGIQDLNTELE